MTWIATGIMAATSITIAIVKSEKAKKAKKLAEKKEKDAANRLAALEANRQAVVNPYDSIKDLSGTFSNPMANLGVATQAAEIQMQQSDAALANTLDTLRATGSGAGGATALAQAARQSKKSISANIEKQEMANQKSAAQGEANLQAQLAAEKQRIQQARARGAEFVYSENEEREMGAMDRAQNEINQSRQDARQRQADKDAADMEALNSAGNATGAFIATTYNGDGSGNGSGVDGTEEKPTNVSITDKG
jgi:hypothetical protein